MTGRRRGARSILGSLPAYTQASVVAALVIAAVGLGWWLQQGAVEADRPAVELPLGSAWRRVTLDDGTTLVVVEPGGRHALRPGTWRVLWEDEAGAVVRGTREVVRGTLDLSEAGDPPRSAPTGGGAGDR